MAFINGSGRCLLTMLLDSPKRKSYKVQDQVSMQATERRRTTRSSATETAFETSVGFVLMHVFLKLAIHRKMVFSSGTAAF